MKRIYVGGALSGNELNYLENCRVMMKFGYELFRSGKYAPFVPAFDMYFALIRQDNDLLITVEEYYDYSMAWLEASDALFVLPNWEGSKGTIAEIIRATELNIPIFYTRQAMDIYFTKEDK